MRQITSGLKDKHLATDQAQLDATSTASRIPKSSRLSQICRCFHRFRAKKLNEADTTFAGCLAQLHVQWSSKPPGIV